MYIPALNLNTDKESTLAFMQRYSFATIVSVQGEVPVATHLPFVISTRGDDIVLTAHTAKQNDQWKTFSAGTVLVIFSEPHAYISPSHYDKKLNVPTWNYVAVHCYGRAAVISDSQRVMQCLEEMIDLYEPAYKPQWQSLPDDYKAGMANGIVAFEILVTEIQAKEKLSQNKNEAERKRIADALAQSHDSNEQAIGEYMKGK
jgi:transcriptional regulator